MKILYWNPIYVLGGGFNLLNNLLEQFAGLDEVQSVTAVVNAQYGDTLRRDNWRSKIVTVTAKQNADIRQFINGHDVVYTTWPHGLAVPQINLPTVCVFQDTIVLDAIGGNSTRSFLELHERVIWDTLEGYTKVIVTSEYTRQRMSALTSGRYDDKLFVLPHIASDAQKHPIRSPRTESPDQQPYILYPANVSEHKNHHSLLVALSKRRRRDVKLVLCGYGTEVIGNSALSENAYVNKLNRTIQTRGLRIGEDFVSKGYVTDSEATALLDGAHGLIMPTRAEGMGLPIHEAIERRLPVIASDLPVLREHFSPRSKAILWVDPDCPDELARAWDRLCDDGKTLRTLAVSSYRDSGRSWKDIAKETCNLLREAKTATTQPGAVTYKMQPRILKRIRESLTRIRA